MKKKYLTILLSITAVIMLVLSFLSFRTSVLAESMLVQNGTEYSSEGDAFNLSEVNYEENESFVYTAEISFERGQAAGLIFGAEDNERYFVFNIDRIENKVKLLYFSYTEGSLKSEELLVDWFIGNDKITESEKLLVNPKVASLASVQLKVIITFEGEIVHGEFFADNIKRFGIDNDFIFGNEGNSSIPEYKGGYIGINTFASKVIIKNAYYGKSDYSYYTEAYRQQYHFSQYSHWNNDPNGLVYYNGWYNLYYQHHPYSNYWSDMYWGHARSRDLLNWELLPICLFPDRDWSTGDGYMWSGSAMVYHKGDSSEIDRLNWFENGKGEGLIAFYTRDGGYQDQMIMSSDDEGMTWTKRKLIPQSLIYQDGKTDCRDPKVFSLVEEDGKTTMWGMVLTGYSLNKVWFLKSNNLLDWTYAGGFDAKSPECPDLVKLKADNNETHWVLTLTSRYYLVGDLSYNTSNGTIDFLDLNGKSYSSYQPGELVLRKMDYGPDSYASQTYYIDDEKSLYFGKTISMSWFSGVPNAPASIESGSLASLRKTWNGGGMTIPVEYSLKYKNGEYLLSEKPILVDSNSEYLSEMVCLENIEADSNNELLKGFYNNKFILTCDINVIDATQVLFNIFVGDNERTIVGWSMEDGYFVDRTYTSDGGLTMNNYRVKYASGNISDSNNINFVIVADNGGVEVFCENGTIPFYVLTFALPYSQGASLETNGKIKINSLNIKNVASVWNSASDDETIINIDKDIVNLDTTLSTKSEIFAYSTNLSSLNWEIESGNDIITLETTKEGCIVKALKEGIAIVKVSSGNSVRNITINVTSGKFDSDFDFTCDGIKSGEWLVNSNGLKGTMYSGDGYILSETIVNDFMASVRFDINTGAAAVIFRSNKDMTKYYIANVDRNENVVKLWNNERELGREPYIFTSSLITLTVMAEGRNIKVSVNGELIFDVVDESENTLNEGYFGLNVFLSEVLFRSAILCNTNYSYSDGDMIIKMETSDYVKAVFNKTLGNLPINKDFIIKQGRNLTIKEEYFLYLKDTGVYEFLIEYDSFMGSFTINVLSLPEISINDFSITLGENGVLPVYRLNVEEVLVNGVKSDYTLNNGVIMINALAFSEGENEIIIKADKDYSFTIQAERMEETIQATKNSCKSVVGVDPILFITLTIAVVIITSRRKQNVN